MYHLKLGSILLEVISEQVCGLKFYVGWLHKIKLSRIFL